MKEVFQAEENCGSTRQLQHLLYSTLLSLSCSSYSVLLIVLEMKLRTLIA